MDTKIQVYIVDDHPLFRQGVRLFLENQDSIAIVGEADTGQDALIALEDREVDVVLLDLQMPGLDGLGTLEKLREKRPTIRVLVLTSFGAWEMVHKALQGGAMGYVLKDSPPEELLAAIQTVAAGGVCFGSNIAQDLVTHLNQRAEPTGEKEIDSLTPREEEVLQLMVRGLSNREIARDLTVSEKTVKSHVASILQKMDVRSRTQAALLALRRGLVRE